jgi:hypothetical protein
MAEPTLISPNTGNYLVGKGQLYFKREGAPDFVHMGNATAMEFTPSLDKLDHFSSMEGIKTKDASIVLTRSGEVKLTLDEWTPSNLSLAVLGSVDELAVGGPTVEIFDQDAVTGELKFIASNDVGPRWDYHYFNVSFIPSETLNPISDEWGQIVVSGEVLVSQTAPNVGRVGFAQMSNLGTAS